MTYRGFDPGSRLLRWALVAIAIGIVLGATLPAAASALLAVAQDAPSKLPWVATRLFAFLSYFALAGSVIYGLLLSTKLLDAIAHRPVTYALHQDLAAIALGLAGIHVVLLGLDNSVPFSFAQMLVPFAAPYRPIWIGIGQLALYITAVVLGSFYVRRRIGQRAWRLLHYLTFLAFIGATAHGVLSGTDSTTAWAWLSYVGALGVVTFLTAYRIFDAIALRGERAARAAARGEAPDLRGPLERRTPTPRGATPHRP